MKRRKGEKEDKVDATLVVNRVYEFPITPLDHRNLSFDVMVDWCRGDEGRQARRPGRYTTCFNSVYLCPRLSSGPLSGLGPPCPTLSRPRVSLSRAWRPQHQQLHSRGRLHEPHEPQEELRHRVHLLLQRLCDTRVSLSVGRIDTPLTMALKESFSDIDA